ncbi:hypothetical protein Q765_05705 [Flavobacterium rivuli WB 3.3-2 = DSM 21788]|uniref:DUF2071 domain-containing protein n=1 Tax=Flavobacterium rivuli WB 3.3-2 = DSM 21788 TaxID=1121895 RepID=A0A0A2M7M6_9FLAO|nr:DUF2071 domain-containing protein [Flavobacterium rivuli]KGO87626.1 hypothetical protein Q765_05705 [Flavobacterium rivuli WB 3.3-2 = DSM 21788]
MKIPAIHGYIDRRILINYTLDPDVASALLPAPFRPLLHNGRAIMGICLIRLKNIKPKGFNDMLGISSENGAHRFAVEWDENGITKQGVYIPRRDTSSYINTIAGGRLFPGKHYKAKFSVDEQAGNYNVGFVSNDATTLSISASQSNLFPQTSIFENLESASAFFQNGSLGYTPAGKGFDGVKLHTLSWQVSALAVHSVQSSYFEDEIRFPKGSVVFDNALLMKNIEHEWQMLQRIP